MVRYDGQKKCGLFEPLLQNFHHFCSEFSQFLCGARSCDSPWLNFNASWLQSSKIELYVHHNKNSAQFKMSDYFETLVLNNKYLKTYFKRIFGEIILNHSERDLLVKLPRKQLEDAYFEYEIHWVFVYWWISNYYLSNYYLLNNFYKKMNLYIFEVFCRIYIIKKMSYV